MEGDADDDLVEQSRRILVAAKNRAKPMTNWSSRKWVVTQPNWPGEIALM